MRNNGLPNVGEEATALIYFLTQHSVVRIYIFMYFNSLQALKHLYLVVSKLVPSDNVSHCPGRPAAATCKFPQLPESMNRLFS